MNKCTHPDCPGTADKDSTLCLKHTIEALVTTLQPAPVEPPHEVHGRFMREIRMRRYQAMNETEEGAS